MGDRFQDDLARLAGNTITNLALEKNGIGAQGAERLAMALERNTSLTTLNLTEKKFIKHELVERIHAKIEQNKAGLRVLTVWCSQQSSERCKVACFDIGGSQVVGIDIELTASLAKLQEAIFAETNHKGHWRLITPTGKLLDNPTMLIADVLGDCTP